MEFKKYQHLERFGTPEVQDIEIGKCYVFPKLDGTNAQLWWNGGLQGGSRNRQLSVDNDNAGFYQWALQQKNIIEFMSKHSTIRLYGEWLVPHTLRTYVDDAWKDFYVFDVYDEINNRYMSYEEYKETLDEYNINYIPPLCVIKNPSDDTLFKCLDKNFYLIKDNEGTGEGIVIKNYEYKNPYGRTVWAKIVRNEFKAKNQKVFGPSEIKEKSTVEETIVNEFVTGCLVEKEFSKIALEGWESKKIPQFLHTVYYNLVKEESWEFIKKHKNPTINFKRLMSLTYAKVKELKPEVF